MTSKSKSQLLALSLVCGALLLTSRAAMAQVEFVGVNAKATLTDNNTVATVTGSIVCGPSETFQINSVVQQNHAQTKRRRVREYGTGRLHGLTPAVCGSGAGREPAERNLPEGTGKRHCFGIHQSQR